MRFTGKSVLITGAENGYLLPVTDEGKSRGGAAELLGRWVASEGHCAGPLKETGDAACENGSTIVVSTGDNANGQAISSYFKGEPTAELMRQMGYAASALGNRELDFNTEGLVHIGLLPELIEDARRDAVDPADLEPLFRSAEGYIRMWELAEARSAELGG